MAEENETHPIDVVVGKNLRRLRAAAGYTQETFGAALPRACASQQISKYELGQNSLSSPRLAEFAIVLRCPVSAFFDNLAGMTSEEEQASRGATAVLKAYNALPPLLQTAVRVLLGTMAKYMDERVTITSTIKPEILNVKNSN